MPQWNSSRTTGDWPGDRTSIADATAAPQVRLAVGSQVALSQTISGEPTAEALGVTVVQPAMLRAMTVRPTVRSEPCHGRSFSVGYMASVSVAECHVTGQCPEPRPFGWRESRFVGSPRPHK